MNTRIILLAALLTAPALAGPLTPPAGPVAPTPGPEPRTPINATNTPGDADSLFKITQRGSYYLTGNITGVVGKHAIEIVVSGVTLDLMGFDIAGGAGSLDGVSATAGGLSNIAVVNGTVRFWGEDGVDLATAEATNCRVTGLSASDNAGVGISVTNRCTVSNCSAFSNTGAGISPGNDSIVASCSASQNGGSGIGGLFALSGTITNCDADNNAVGGIFLLSGTVLNCSAYYNVSNGITVGSSSRVVNCTTVSNSVDGIQCGSICVIRGNTNSGGGAAGIHTTGSNNLIEGNNCLFGNRGIQVDSVNSIIIKNTCSLNTVNWDIAVGNAVARIIQAATNGVAISGDTYAGGFGSSDPTANFTY